MSLISRVHLYYRYFVFEYRPVRLNEMCQGPYGLEYRARILNTNLDQELEESETGR